MYRVECLLWPPADDGNETVRQGELRFQETGIPTTFDHVANARIHTFDVSGEIERMIPQAYEEK